MLNKQNEIFDTITTSWASMFNEATFPEMLVPSLPMKYLCSWRRLWTLNRQAKIYLHKTLKLESFRFSQLFSLLSNLFLYWRKSFLRNTTHPKMLAHLKRFLKDVSLSAYIRDFAVPYYNNCVDSTNLYFYETCNLTKVAIWCKYGYFPNTFRITF